MRFCQSNWVPSDAGISGKRADNRPGLQDALAAICERRRGALVVFSLSRLARSTKDAIAIAERLDKPMMIGLTLMVITGVLLYYAIPVRTTQSLWFRIKVMLFVLAAINAFAFRARMQASVGSWDTDPKPPRHIRMGAAASILLWAGVVVTGRTIAYDWFDCHKELPYAMYWAAGCVDEMAAFASE